MDLWVVMVTEGTVVQYPPELYGSREAAEDEGASGKTGVTRSVYQPNGLVAGSERGERFFFWPMGIASAGQMRQWSHHATAFVGRRHFDDARLIEKYFEISFLATR